MDRERWFERTFVFDLPTGRFPFLLERLRGMPVRAEEKVRGVGRDLHTRRLNDTWSIQENLGHLIDLEALHMRRLEELAVLAEVGRPAGDLPMLAPADLENRATWEANHNVRSIEEVLRDLRRGRTAFVTRLESWDPVRLDVAGIHPRLKQPMRVIDLAYFVAEHDDYHLARVQELLITFAGRRR